MRMPSVKLAGKILSLCAVLALAAVGGDFAAKRMKKNGGGG